MKYLGDYAEDYATLNFKFTTHQADGTPYAMADTPVVSVYKANDITQSVAGVTLSQAFDGVVGLHNVLIDLSADAFYAVANDYSVVLTAGTCDSISLAGYVLATFSIENRNVKAAVTSIAANAITTAAINDGAITNAKVADDVDVNVKTITANAITATAINADAITDAKVAADVTIASVSGAVGSVTGAVGSVTGGTGLSAQETRDAMKLAPTAGDPAAGSVDAELDSIVTATAAGTGFTTKQYTVNDADGDPITNVYVKVTSDSAGSTFVAQAYTNTLGIATFTLANGTYYMWRQHPNYTFSDPDTEIVV